MLLLTWTMGIKGLQPIKKSSVSHSQNEVERIEGDNHMGKFASTSTCREITPKDLHPALCPTD